MNRKLLFTNLIIIATLVLVISINTESEANAGGRGDDNREYSCGKSCHMAQSSRSEITMECSNSEPLATEEIGITVIVTGTEQAEGKLIGAYLLVALEGADSQPSVNGWVIVEDPNGGTCNYVEKAADGDGGVTFIWKLAAPETPAEYTFYAREDHGGGDKYYKNFEAGLKINVLPNPDLPADDEDKDETGDGNEGNGSQNGSEIPGDSEADVDTNDDKYKLEDVILSTDADFLPIVLGIVIAGIIVLIIFNSRH